MRPPRCPCEKSLVRLDCAAVNRSGAFFSLSSTLRTIAEQYGLSSRMLEQRLRRDWRTIVGEQIARHTHPDSIRYKKLYLIADHPAWLQHLQFLKPSLIEKINAAAGEPIVTDLILRVGEMATAAVAHPSVSASTPVPEPTVWLEAEGTAQALADPGLRASWTAVMARALQRQPARQRRLGP